MAHMVHFVRSVEESKDLTHDSTPKIVISASGMATGGRVLHHLIQLAPDSRNTVLFVGHQAIGTRGNSIVNGAKHVRIYGQDVEIRARIEHLNMLSAHADAEDLVRWLGSEQSTPIRTYLNHGEPDASAALQENILRQLGWQVEVPAFATTIDTDALQSTTREAVHRG
jgi:metallo-beta-lactamase family protein